MPKITYIPPEGDAAETQWGKYLFKANVPLEVSDRHILAKAAANPHFSVEGAKLESGRPGKPAPETKPETGAKPDPKAEGFTAAREGKSDVVPKPYRGKPEETLWVEGFISFEKAGEKPPNKETA